MKKLLNLSIILSACLLILSCGGGGGGGGGAVSGGSSSKSAVVIGLDGLSMRSATRAAATSVWDTLTSVNLTVYADGESVFNKVLTASDNVALVEDVDVGSSVYASAIVTFNEANGGGTAEAKSDTIEVQPGSNNLSLAITYKYELMYCGKDNDWHEKTGTYTYASGIPLPADFSEINEYGNIFSCWSSDVSEVADVPNGERERTSYPKNLVGVRGNLSLYAEYVEAPVTTFNVTYHFERNGVTVATPKVYTYSPFMADTPDYAYTKDIMLVIDSCDTGLGDFYLESIGDSVFDEYCPTSDTTFLISALNDTSSATQGAYILRKNDGSYSNQTIEIKRECTLLFVGNTISSFIMPELDATEVRYVINNPSIDEISPYAVYSGLQTTMTYLELLGTEIMEIPDNCFKDCTALNAVLLPNYVLTIKPGAFDNCSGLVYVSYDGTLDDWNYFGTWGGLETNSTVAISTSDHTSIIYNGSNWSY